MKPDHNTTIGEINPTVSPSCGIAGQASIYGLAELRLWDKVY